MTDWPSAPFAVAAAGSIGASRRRDAMVGMGARALPRATKWWEASDTVDLGVRWERCRER